MSLVKWAFIAVLLLPAAEIGVFILAVLLVGWLWAITLFLATSAAGVILLRRFGRSDLDRVRHALVNEGLRAVHLETPGFAPILGGILLVFPGFITDLMGAALLVPQVRRWVGAMLRRAAQTRRQRRAHRGATVIDLEPDEWQRLPDLSSKKPRKNSSNKRRAGQDKSDRRTSGGGGGA